MEGAETDNKNDKMLGGQGIEEEVGGNRHVQLAEEAFKRV